MLTSLSHPVHPTTVHFPLTFLSTAYSLDTLYGLVRAYPSLPLLTRLSPLLPQLSTIAYLSHFAGVVTALPSMTSGTAEFWELYKTGGINREDKMRTNPGPSGKDVVDSSVKIGMWHGILNTAAFGYSAYVAWSRWGIKEFRPTRAQVLVSALMVPGVAVSAALGGELVYGKGIGVQRMGPALEEKLEGIKEQKKAAQ